MMCIGFASTLNDVDTWVAIGLANVMTPRGISLHRISMGTVQSETMPEAARELLLEIGVRFQATNVNKCVSNDTTSCLLGLVLVDRSDDVGVLQEKHPALFQSPWELLHIDDVEGDFRSRHETQQRIRREQLRSQLQHFFRRSDGLFVDDDF